MKKTLALALTFGLLAGTMGVPAEAGKKKAKVRFMEVRYENPAFGLGGAGGGCAGCPAIATGPGETFAMIQVIDDVSPNGYVTFAYDSDGDGFQNIGAGPAVCGSTPEPVEMEPSTGYTAWPWLAGVECPGASSTSGTIKIWFGSDPAALKKAAAKG